MEEKEEISSENPNEEEENEEEIEEGEAEEDEEGEEEENNEEEILQAQIEEVDFGSLLKAKAKLSYNNSKSKSKQKSKTEIMNELKAKNKTKLKNAPREYSALIKPKYQYKDQAHQQNNNTLLKKKYHRDPRFDDLSGELNETSFKKNFSFVGEMAKEYVEKINKVKKNKKYKQKMPQETYDLLKKQNNYVKGWINQQKQKESKQEIKTEINKENKKRMSKGQKPIYINKSKVNKFIKKQKNKTNDE